MKITMTFPGGRRICIERPPGRGGAVCPPAAVRLTPFEERRTPMTENYESYLFALEGAGPKLKEIILDRAARDKNISLSELCALTRAAYPEEV